MKPLLALDIGGTRSRAALVAGAELLWRAEMPTLGLQGPASLLARLRALVAPVLAQAERVGACIAGQVCEGRVSAPNADIFAGLDRHPFESALAECLGRPVRLVNDARAAAWAEFLHGAGRGCAEFGFVTVSTGIGAGFVLGGRLHLARNGLDAELGETLVDEDRPLETLAGGLALSQQARCLGLADARALGDAAAHREDAHALWQDGIERLARKLADLAVLLGLERVALGGSVGLRSDYLPAVRAALQRLPALYRVELVQAALGDAAGLVGAAALA